MLITHTLTPRIFSRNSIQYTDYIRTATIQILTLFRLYYATPVIQIVFPPRASVDRVLHGNLSVYAADAPLALPLRTW